MSPEASDRPQWLALRVLRVGQWRHFVVLPAAALLVASPTPLGQRTLEVAVASVAAGLCMAFAYGLNAVSDRPDDLDPEKNPLAGGLQPPLSVYASVWGCAVLAMALGIWSGPVGLAAVALSLGASLVYSMGPRFKAKPLLGAFTNGCIFTPLLAFAVERPEDLRSLGSVSLVFFVLLLQNQLIHEVDDRLEDAARNRTTALMLGARGALQLAALSGFVGSVVIALLPGSIERVPGALGMIAGGLLALRADTLPRARRRHRWLSMATGAAMFALAMWLGSAA